MQIKIGEKEYNKKNCEEIYKINDLEHNILPYDAIDSPMHPRWHIGEEYTIYKSKNNSYPDYFLNCIIRRINKNEDAIVTDNTVSLPTDIALLLMNRNNKDITINDTKKKHEAIIEDLYLWLDDIKQILKNKCELGDDLFNDLREMLICFNAQAYRGCLALAGVVLERIIKYSLNKNKIEYDNSWMVGKLIKELEKTQYIDPSMKNVWNIINIQRIIGVHAKEKISIPSKDQTAMVIFAIKDIINRCFI